MALTEVDIAVLRHYSLFDSMDTHNAAKLYDMTTFEQREEARQRLKLFGLLTSGTDYVHEVTKKGRTVLDKLSAAPNDVTIE